MDSDDLEPAKAPVGRPNLDPMSVAELDRYIAELEDEIARVRAEIAAKQGHRNSAEAFFKK